MSIEKVFDDNKVLAHRILARAACFTFLVFGGARRQFGRSGQVCFAGNGWEGRHAGRRGAMISPATLVLAGETLRQCEILGVRMVTAESCTGGLIAAALTSQPGSSSVFDRAFVVYSYEAKREVLGIEIEALQGYGAVSEIVARAMAENALQRSEGRVRLSIAATGVAGPSRSATKPVGLVHLAAAGIGLVTLHERHEFGDRPRHEVRDLTVSAALRLVLRQLQIIKKSLGGEP